MNTRLKKLYGKLQINPRKDWLVDLIYHIGNPLIFGTNYLNLKVIGEDNIKKIGEEPILYLSRHHDERDILCQQKATKEIRNKYPSYLVKKDLEFLNSLNLGVFPYFRSKDMKTEIKSSTKTKKDLERYNNKVYFELIPQYLASGEDFLIYPEGTRREGKPFKVANKILEDIVSLVNITTNKFKITPIIVPIDYKYLENNITMKFGDSLILNSDENNKVEVLKNHLYKNINY